MIKWLFRVILILMAITLFSTFVSTWFNNPEASVLHPEEFVRTYGNGLFASPLFWIIIVLLFASVSINVLRKK